MAQNKNSEVKYYYIGSKTPTVKTKQLQRLSQESDSFNPIFNFSQDFISKLNSISPTKLAQSEPYISIKTVNMKNEIIEDFNLSFFHKPLEINNIGTGTRYSDRPAISLKGLDITTDLASGYLYYTNVTLKLKIHKPDILTSTTLMALLYPGAPLLLEYGWNSPDDFLNEKEKLLFAVKTYDIAFDITGQIDLTVIGMAFNEKLNNTLIGDTGQEYKVPGSDDKSAGSLRKSFNDITKLISFLEDLKVKKGSKDYKLVQDLADRYEKIETRVRDTNFRTAFKNSAKNLKGNLIKLVNFNKFTKGPKATNCIRFHDVVYTLCHETFEGLTSIFPSTKELRIIYGSFNEFNSRAGESIADFPIDLRKFNDWKQNAYGKGEYSITVEKLLNKLIDFTETEEYWKGFINPKKKPKEIFDKPDVAMNFNNREIVEGDKKVTVVELSFVDTHNGLPITTAELPKGEASDHEAEAAVLRKDKNFPIIRLGHANSFIKNITLHQISDEFMKATLISRMAQDRITNVRDTIDQGSALGTFPVTPLTLPLKGTASVLGHVRWKPFRAFYLATGIFITSAVYKITKVSHKLGPEGFSTDIEFMWH